MDLPKETGEGVRIVLVTDLHSCFYGKGQHRLISMIDKEKPDIVLLGGDIFDDKLSDDNAKLLLEDLVTKYPCYYVTGNHEYWSERVDEMKAYLESIGVSVLEGECETVEINGATIDICGVDDPTRLFLRTWLEQLDTAYEQTDEDHIRILVTHRPEEVSVYEKYDYDLIVAGHAHAGQFRIPFINRGVFAPNQGYMAEYVSGTYELSNGSVMVVSRGLARESTPAPRYFNHPEIVVIDLE
ncbi:MAG: metallophosphoesterase [Lachnospiraceae bacterium]|nr:metallophosphoesterase [Lachnospiraceae bacterium]